MTNLKIKIIIDGDNYSEKQLEYISYEREKHVLQEMIYLDAKIPYKGKNLSFDDVNYLSYKEAKEINLQARKMLGAEGIRKLYENELERSAQMWRDISKSYHDDDSMIPATADIVVEGMTLETFREKLTFVLSGGDSSVMSEHPEHFHFASLENDDVEKVGIETMGMYGGPTEVIVIPGYKSIPSDEGFLPSLAGTSKLLDGTLRRDIAHHQMRKTEQGFNIRTRVYFPKDTPKEMIEGHKLHLAMETYEMIKAAATV